MEQLLRTEMETSREFGVPTKTLQGTYIERIKQGLIMSNKYDVRVANRNDESSVSAVLAASYPALMAAAYSPEFLASAVPLMTKAQPHLLTSGTYYVAYAMDDHIVGCGGWTMERPHSGEVEIGLAHLRHFAVAPPWTGRGVGRAIYDRCAAEAKSADVTQFECYASLNAEGFYAALGFRTVKPLDVRMTDELTLASLLMERRLVTQ